VALHRELLARAHLSVISAEPDHELDQIAQAVTGSVRVGGRAELEGLFGRLLAATGGGGAATIAPKTLDLLGHSTARTGQLRLGDWVIDAASPEVTALFRELADRDVLPRLGIHAVRLLACRTAETAEGRATICRLAEILGVAVYGTSHLLYGVHYDAHGFRDIWEFLLVSSADLQRPARTAARAPNAGPWPRTLEIDALPASPLDARATPWPQRMATPTAVRQILQLIRRDAGAPMPGRAMPPSCELALPSATPGAFHIAHVLLEGMFVRVYPDGTDAPGVVYPVDDARQLQQITEGLSPPAACP
jgi:hypothetical protein